MSFLNNLLENLRYFVEKRFKVMKGCFEVNDLRDLEVSMMALRIF